MELLQLLSWMCIVFTVGMFSTGLTDLKKMISCKSADNIQFLPFLTTQLNNLGWLYYGILKSDGTIILVNTIGALLQVLYIVAYCYYTKEKRRILTQTLVAGVLLAASWFYFSVLPPGEARLALLGLICTLVTIGMYLSPLTDLVQIMRSGNLECLSFPLTVATFLTSTSWTLYGHQLDDLFITIPNMTGVITSLIRFILFWRFSSANQSSLSYKPVKM